MPTERLYQLTKEEHDEIQKISRTVYI